MVKELVVDVCCREDLNKVVQWGLDRKMVFEYDEDPFNMQVFFDYDSMSKGDKISLRAFVRNNLWLADVNIRENYDASLE